MTPTVLLIFATVLYAGYNVFVKASGAAVPDHAQTTVVATISLQLAALTTSAVFAAVLWSRGIDSFALNTPTLIWAIAAGVCIGGAEIAYLYLFGGINGQAPMPASLAIPVIVSGTIIIALFASAAFFQESIRWTEALGAALIIGGIAILFHGKKAA